MARKKPFDLVRSVERAADILDFLSRNETPAGITEISDSLGLAKSTVYRLLATLAYKGLVRQEPETKGYTLGLKLFELGSEVFNELELRDEVRPFLEELVEKVNETAHFVIEDQGEALYIDKVESSHSFRQYSRIGRRAPLHCTAVGKVILAHKSDKEIADLFRHQELKSYTANTITDLDTLQTELEKVNRKGYAVDNEEIQNHLRCAAAAIYNYSGEVVGAISISGPTARVEDIDAIGIEVGKTAAKISARLGYTQGNIV